MEFKEVEYTVQELVAAFKAGSLLRNPEYQRGEAWTDVQKASFVDSILRGYPIPALFLHENRSPGLGGAAAIRHEIVDGQQRLSALRDYSDGKFPLLEIGERSKLRLPRSVREKPAPWAGQVFDSLPPTVRESLQQRRIRIFEIAPDAHKDEVRDLFIRLQSGTALSRQQIRDAWPGGLGPYIERLAGKLDKRPTHRLFALIDKRGQRLEDEDLRDGYVADRQACAQLLRIFIARARDPLAYPSVSANELDSLYHEYTDFDAAGPLATGFEDALNTTKDVFHKVWLKRPGLKNKYRRFDIAAVMMFVQDTSKNPLFKLDEPAMDKLATRIAESERQDVKRGKSTSGKALQEYYDWWRGEVAVDIGIRLAPVRLFDDLQKQQIWERDQGRCQMCQKEVAPAEAEYDHYPVAYRDGGATDIANGRLVHATCHARGRPPSAA